MRFTKNTKGFTLIELLVVITIIGILAVGGTATYTAQIQKARDSTRMTDLSALRSGSEQFYQDFTQYMDPTKIDEFTGSGSRSITAYVPKIPKDPKTGQTCAKGTVTDVTGSNLPGCDYLYSAEDDSNGITLGEYKISSSFENRTNVDTKAFKDGGIEKDRLEFGLNLAGTNKKTNCERTGPLTIAGTALVAGTTQCVNGAALPRTVIFSGN